MNYKRLSRSAASSAAKRRHAQRAKTPVATVQAAAHTTSTGTGELAVSDDGPGFDDAALKRADEPFWSASKGAGGHLGLGLYITRSLAEKHGG